MNQLAVACRRADGGWRCDVTVGPEPGTTRHLVTVAEELLHDLDPNASDPTALVEESFRFLLQREPRESILSSFELSMIGRYFPDWDAHIGKAGRD